MTRLWPEGEPVSVWGEEDTPAGFGWRGTSHYTEEVCNRWRVHTRWWQPEEAIWREYIKVTTRAGLLCLLYRDLLHKDRDLLYEGTAPSLSKGWFLARVYD